MTTHILVYSYTALPGRRQDSGFTWATSYTAAYELYRGEHSPAVTSLDDYVHRLLRVEILSEIVDQSTAAVDEWLQQHITEIRMYWPAFTQYVPENTPPEMIPEGSLEEENPYD